MTLELNRATFRRLVQLYILSAIISFAVAGYGSFGPGWTGSDNDLDAIAPQDFNDSPRPEWLMWTLAAAFVPSGLWMIASMFGLLYFKRWARIGTWMSVLLVLVIYVAAFGMEPSYSTPVDDVLAIIDSALLGAIVIVSYAKGLGADWFARPINRT